MFKLLNIVFLTVLCASLARGRLDESIFGTELRELIAALHKQCIQETGVDNDVIEKTNTGEFPDDSKLKCYMKCVLSEGGAMDDEGNLDLSPVESILPPDAKEGIKKSFDICVPRATTHADFCDRAYAFYKCSYETDSDHYFLA